MAVGLGLGVAILAAGLVVPYVVSSRYYMGLLLDGVILAILALSIGFLARHLGLISLGHTAFFGGAAYAVGIAITRWEMSPPVAFVVAVAIGTLIALIMGLLVVRATGMGFLMLTLALGQALYQFSTQRAAAPWTGAYDGLQITYASGASFLGLDRASLMNAALFWPVAWSALIACAVLMWLIGRSSFGTMLEGIRENEERMRFSGFDTFVPRLIAFVVSGFVASIGGALFALNASYVSPELLSFVKAGDALTAAIVGGLGILLGPILGAIVYIFAQARFNTSGNLHLYTGTALVLILMFLPGGIFGSIDKVIRKLLPRRRRESSGSEPDRTADGGPSETSREKGMTG
ncbi:branched-chain amino acid ABC transporter permease [Janibacter sp. YIM B02568]|uniref:branched-chain amino acid ABC transporter permease n=1 Tax=Janibacter endophyticus TaxID=2806261 RepID=UPI0019508808|nr:branched-chain amino acid ABC transporter permease [Janibacter endophyticus]MBM6545436.1 branched-chain amino acid ABC transporter permease [Janibacter endophyticus]